MLSSPSCSHPSHHRRQPATPAPGPSLPSPPLAPAAGGRHSPLPALHSLWTVSHWLPVPVLSEPAPDSAGSGETPPCCVPPVGNHTTRGINITVESLSKSLPSNVQNNKATALAIIKNRVNTHCNWRFHRTLYLAT